MRVHSLEAKDNGRAGGRRSRGWSFIRITSRHRTPIDIHLMMWTLNTCSRVVATLKREEIRWIVTASSHNVLRITECRLNVQNMAYKFSKAMLQRLFSPGPDCTQVISPIFAPPVRVYSVEQYVPIWIVKLDCPRRIWRGRGVKPIPGLAYINLYDVRRVLIRD